MSASHAATFYVRNNPQPGEYGSVKEALDLVTNTSLPLERDIIDVLGVFTDTIRISKSVIIQGHGWSSSILQSFDNKKDPSDYKITANVIVISGGVNVDIFNLSVRYGIDNNKSLSVGGGGICVTKNNGGKVYLEGLEIANNFSRKHSGGIAAIGINLEMRNCYIHHNKCDGQDTPLNGQGGGMNIISSNGGEDSYVKIQGCTFAYNSTKNNNGGGIVVDGNGKYGELKKLNVSIENSTIVFNESAATGGGIFLKGMPYKIGTVVTETTNTTVTLNHCTISRNKVTTLDDKTQAIGLAFAKVEIGHPIFNIYNSIVSLNQISDGFSTKYDVNFDRSLFQNSVNNITGFSNAFSNATFIHNSVESKIDDLNLAAELIYKNNNIVPVLPLLEGSFAIDFCTENSNNIPIPLDQSGLSRIGNADAGASEYSIQSSTSYIYDAPVRLLNNPVQDKLKFFSSDEQIFRVSLYTIAGINILSKDYDQAGLDISQLPKGVYLANVKLSNGNKHVIRFMKN